MESSLTVAVRAAKDAGALILRHFRKKKQIRHKGVDSLVTNVDVAAEKIILSRIKKAFPQHSILAEESGLSGGNSDWQWLIDPIDGTTNYVWGWFDAFGVSIALAYKDIVQLGVIYYPCSNTLFIAQINKGALRNGKKIRVSSTSNLRKSLLLFDAGFSARRVPICNALKKIALSIPKIRMLGVATLEFSFLAQGFADVYMELSTKPWDISAGALLVQQAGGRVTDWDGNTWTSKSKNFIATNNVLHQRVLGISNLFKDSK